MKTRLILLIISLSIASCIPSQVSQPDDNSRILWAADWNSNNEIIVGGNYDVLRLYSFSSKKHLNFKKSTIYPITVTQLKWHPKDDKVVAVTAQSPNQTISIYNTQTEKFVELSGISKDGARGLAWSPDGQFLAVGDNDGFIHIFDKKGQYIKGMDCKQKSITGLSWHPTKNIIATVGKQIVLYNMDEHSIQTIVPRPVDVLMLCVAWHPSGDFFVTGDYGDYFEKYPALLQFWTSDGKLIRNIEESQAEYRNLVWSSDGEKLYSASDGLRIWSKQGKLLKHSKTKELLWGIAISPDNSKVVTTGITGEIKIWDKSGKLIKARTF